MKSAERIPCIVHLGASDSGVFDRIGWGSWDGIMMSPPPVPLGVSRVKTNTYYTLHTAARVSYSGELCSNGSCARQAGDRSAFHFMEICPRHAIKLWHHARLININAFGGVCLGFNVHLVRFES